MTTRQQFGLALFAGCCGCMLGFIIGLHEPKPFICESSIPLPPMKSIDGPKVWDRLLYAHAAAGHCTNH